MKIKDAIGSVFDKNAAIVLYDSEGKSNVYTGLVKDIPGDFYDSEFLPLTNYTGLEHSDKILVNLRDPICLGLLDCEENEIDVFWREVDKINWPNRGYKNVIDSKYKKRFGEIARKLRKDLQKKIEDYQQKKFGNKYALLYGVSDDSYWDLCAHVVGLGKGAYYDVLKNPLHITAYLRWYKENFEYCFS